MKYFFLAPAIKCARQLWKGNVRNPVLIVRGGFQLFSRHYPFLRTQKILWTMMELEALQTYPFEIISSAVFQGTRGQAERPEVLKDCKIGAVVNCTEEPHVNFDEKHQLQISELKDDIDDNYHNIFKRTSDFIQQHTAKGKRVFIYSENGVNRSVVLAIACLMSLNNQPLEVCLSLFLQNCLSLLTPIC